MKVGLVVEWLDPRRGGAETSTRQFIDELLALGLSLEVYTRSDLPEEPNLCIHRLDTWAPTRAGRTAAFLRAAEHAIARADCDLIHAFIPCKGSPLYQPRGGLVIETIHRTIASYPPGFGRTMKRVDLALNRRQKLLLQKERNWFTGADRPVVIAISRYVCEQLCNHYNYPNSHIRYILNGVNVEHLDQATRAARREQARATFPSLTKKTVETVALQVCHNFRLKGLETSIRALAKLHSPRDVPIRPITLLVAGRDNPGPWMRLARRLGVADQVEFVGAIDDPATLFLAADVLVHPTFYDPCSRVVLEAMSYGLPVVTTRFDGAAEIVEEGPSGYVLDSPDDAVGLAECLRKLVNPARQFEGAPTSPALWERVSMARHAREVVDVYTEMIRAQPTAGQGKSRLLKES